MNQVTPRIIFWLFFSAAILVTAGVFVFSERQIAELESDISLQKQDSQQEIESNSEALKILFAGDVFLDRSIRRNFETNGIDYIWRNITPFLSEYKYIVANLEGPVWNRPQAAPSGSFNFAFQEEYVQKLTDLGFTAVSLANNHTLNQSLAGLSHSRNFLERIGLHYFGDPNNVVDYSFITYLYENNELNIEAAPQNHCGSTSFKQQTISEIHLALVGEHDLVNTGQDKILSKILEFKNMCYFVIVLPHWGPEYVLEIPAVERMRAYQLVDAGADLIIGSHPHVVQPIEIYKGSVIFYSLGNFLFDQYFSYDTLHGLLVEVNFEEDGLRFVLYPTEQNSTFQIRRAQEEAQNKMLERISSNSVVPMKTQEDIKRGYFSVPYKIN